MNIQYTTHCKNNFISTAVLMLAGFVLLTVLSNLLIPLLLVRQVAAFVYVILLAYYIIRYILTSFSYILTEQTFSVIKMLSGHDTLLAEIPTACILSVCRQSKEKGIADNVTSQLFPHNYCVVAYQDGKQIRKLKIEYDAELFSGLTEILEEKSKL